MPLQRPPKSRWIRKQTVIHPGCFWRTLEHELATEVEFYGLQDHEKNTTLLSSLLDHNWQNLPQAAWFLAGASHLKRSMFIIWQQNLHVINASACFFTSNFLFLQRQQEIYVSALHISNSHQVVKEQDDSCLIKCELLHLWLLQTAWWNCYLLRPYLHY